MPRFELLLRGAAASLFLLAALPAGAQNFMVQCPTSTATHPSPSLDAHGNWLEPAYTGPFNVPFPGATQNGVAFPYISSGGTIKCQQISGGDGYMTEADGNQTFMFAFGPLSGLGQIASGQPGTSTPEVFNQSYCNGSGTYYNGQPNPYVNGQADPLYTGTNSYTVACNANGAVGYVPPMGFRSAKGVTTLSAGNVTTSTAPTYVSYVVIDTNNEIACPTGAAVCTGGSGYMSAPTVSIGRPTGTSASPCTVNNTIAPTPANPYLTNPPPPAGSPCVQATAVATISNGMVVEVAVQNGGMGYTSQASVSFSGGNPAGNAPARTDAAAIMNTGVMNGNIPAPLFAFDEDDEFFLTLTNVGMIMRPDLFEQHTVHFHGYPNASSFYDGVPDASLAINIGASFTYYYLAPDAGTYFWHCHITPPEHLQMGMVGQLFVRPRQNRVPDGTPLATASAWQQQDLRTACITAGAGSNGTSGESNLYAGYPAAGGPTADILCSTPPPGSNNANPNHVAGNKYVYDDGDGSTRYDIDVPVQIHGFDPNFHFVGMTFNPEGFSDMKDKYFLLNGRSYPDTITTGAMSTAGSDGQSRPSQPLPSLITLSHSGGSNGPQRAALRIADLDVTEYQTLGSIGIPMHVVGYNAKLLRDQAGNNMDYFTNSITLGGGESLDVILDASLVPPGTYFLYTPNLDHLSNDAENFGGLMTEVVVTN